MPVPDAPTARYDAAAWPKMILCQHQLEIQLNLGDTCFLFKVSCPDGALDGWLANELVATLAELLPETERRAARGPQNVAVRLARANNGAVLQRLEGGHAFDFRMAAGGDHTDEDVFELLPSDAWTVHIGDGPSRARYREATPAAVCRLLGEMVHAMPV